MRVLKAPEWISRQRHRCGDERIKRWLSGLSKRQRGLVLLRLLRARRCS